MGFINDYSKHMLTTETTLWNTQFEMNKWSKIENWKM